FSLILAEQGAAVTSIDVAPGQVRLACRRMQLHGLTWDARIGSAYRLTEEFAPESFDLVFGYAVLHHLTLDLPRVYACIQQVLVPGGLGVMTEPYSGSRALRALRERCSWLIPLDRETSEERPLERRDL